MTHSNQNNPSSDRLERIEALVEANSQAIAENSRAVAQQRRNISELAQVAQTALTIAQNNREDLQQTERLTRRNAAAIDRLEQKMEQYIIEGRENREFIATQVEGIKVETRRIVEHLFGDIEEK